jgi:DNA-binding CsgD family transcriptional regulator
VDKWPLVGRKRELAQLNAAVIAHRGAVITGPAGVGKTTLATVCLQVAQDRGMSLTRTTATRASRALPFGAFASILPPDPGDDILGWEDQGALLRRYSQSVVRGAEGHPLVVFVDDAHLLDDGSATLVHQLALAQAATVLATVRLGESAPDPVVALWKDGPAERIQVGVLADAAIEELVVTVLGGQVDAASLRELVHHSQGNPLFLRELVTGALESGALVEEGGFWRLRGALQPTDRLVELVALRLGNLTEPEVAVLELLTLGEPLGQATLAQLADPTVVDTLEDKGLIASRVDGRRVQVWLAHPVCGDVVRIGISAIRERALARSLAEVTEATGGRRREDTLLLASLRLVSGGGSAELFVSGAMAARTRHDYFLTERLARAAIDEGSGFEARFMAAEAAHVQGRPDQSEHELAALAVQATSDAERARVALLRFDNAYRLQGRETDLRLIDDAVDAITDPSWRDELLTRRALVTIASYGPRAGIEVASTLLERPGSRPLTAADTAVSYSLVRIGRLDDAIQLLTPPPGSPEVPATDEPWDRWTLFDIRTLALVYAGRLVEAEELLTRAYDQVVVEPLAEAKALVSRRLAVLHLEQGRLQRAFLRASESSVHFQQIGRTFPARWPYVAAAQALALMGQADRAAETLAALDALGLPTWPIIESDLLQARAWTAAAAGDIPGARAQLEAAADVGEEIGDLIGATSALHSQARLGRARHVASRLSALAQDVDGDLVAGRAAYANAVAARDAEALDKVSLDFEDMGAILYAAEARAEAAVLLRRAGKTRQAAAAEQKAARFLARCEGAATLPVQTIAAQVRLSPGELDTALQAAAGRTNRQIASDMNLSVRTVENHLQRVYEKLGVSGRHELADALLSSQPPNHRPRP